MVQNKEPTLHDKQLVALGRILQTLREERKTDALIDAVIQYIRAEFDYALIWIGLYNEEEHHISGKGGVTPGREAAFLYQGFSLNPGDLLEQVVTQQRPLAVADLRMELRAGEWRSLAESCNIQATLLFPVRHQERCYGVVLLGSTLWGATPRTDVKARLSMVLGELALALFHIYAEQQRQQIKRPDQPLLSLLERLGHLDNLGLRLQAIVEETQHFIQPSRTSLYWFNREQRYFWRRVTHQPRSPVLLQDNSQMAPGISFQDVHEFYQALAAGQLVVIEQAGSSLKADVTTRLLQLMRAQALLVAPILVEGDVYGFVAVESGESHTWQEAEKVFVQGSANLVALTAPLEVMEEAIAQAKQDQQLAAEVAQAIYSEDDWKAALSNASERVCQCLAVHRFLVLVVDPDNGTFAIGYQNYRANQTPLRSPLPALGSPDWKLLEKTGGPIQVENIASDHRFLEWRNQLINCGLQSLLICSTNIGRSLEGAVLVGHSTPRVWSHREQELVRVVSQQIGLIIHQWQLQKQTDQQQKINQVLHHSLLSLQQITVVEQLEQKALQFLTQLLQAPLAVLVGWNMGETTGYLRSSPIPNEAFAINIDTSVLPQTDSLVHWVLETSDLIVLSIQSVTADTRQWLNAKGIDQILAIALRTAPDHEPTGMVLVADGPERQWSNAQLQAFKTLVNQLAWYRRWLRLTQLLTEQRETYQRLAWYKQAYLEEGYRSITSGLHRLNELSDPQDPLFPKRYHQLVRHLQDLVARLDPVVETEQWQLRLLSQNLSLISLLKRTLNRIESLIQQRHIWFQVHNQVNLTISGDISKTELILYELLLYICFRVEPGGRIDIWCRQIDSRWLDLSITDNGCIDPRLLVELEAGRSPDLLAISPLDTPPGLHLMLGKTLTQQIGGDCSFYKLEDGRLVTRLILPLTSTSSVPDVPATSIQP